MQIVITHQDQLVAKLAALAISLHVIESVLPSPVPGIKPGLANVITITVLVLYGWRMAIWVSLLRVFVGSLMMGTFMSPTFVLSLSGALGSLVILGVFSQRLWFNIGPIGLAVMAALAHTGGQFWVAYQWFIPHEAMFRLLPVLLTAALVFGLVTGLISQTLLKNYTRTPR